MMHEDIARAQQADHDEIYGTVADLHRVRLSAVRWSDRFTKGAFGIGLVLIGSIVIRWIGQ